MYLRKAPIFSKKKHSKWKLKNHNLGSRHVVPMPINARQYYLLHNSFYI